MNSFCAFGSGLRHTMQSSRCALVRSQFAGQRSRNRYRFGRSHGCMLGVPPAWYKSLAYRSRTVVDPRGVLAEFGVELPKGVEVRVHDSTADLRYIVLPMRPKGTRDWSEEQLAALVTRDSMVGTAVPAKPSAPRRRDAA